jgi:hypothetical protein
MARPSVISPSEIHIITAQSNFNTLLTSGSRVIATYYGIPFSAEAAKNAGFFSYSLIGIRIG